jgi:hypothetical protein
MDKPQNAIAMLDEMKNLAIEDKEKVMRRRDVFEAHIALNPSIMEAISLCRDMDTRTENATDQLKDN